jgi:carbon-monoxide dehydrogenase small subunit
MKKQIRIRVNGQEREVTIEARQTLLDVLRYDLRLTGTKEGCGDGNCGSCTVLLNGEAVNSCLVFAVEVDG